MFSAQGLNYFQQIEVNHTFPELLPVAFQHEIKELYQVFHMVIPIGFQQIEVYLTITPENVRSYA
jgi:hypothetical protein